MKRPVRVTLFAMLGLGVLAACGTNRRQEDRAEIVASVFNSLKNKITGQGEAAAQGLTPEQVREIAPALIEQVSGPVLLFSQQRQGTLDILALNGEVGPYRVFASSSGATITLEGGVLAETRRLGNDLMSSENGPLPQMLANRQEGDYQRVMRTLDGEGHEVATTFDCRLGFSGPDRMKENCTTPGDAFRNIYEFVEGTDRLAKSDQWLNEANGYISIEYLRY
ncbi:YjbF family lipoprotein [Donghicola mangrovi]|uniref:YjbF family lipoprotein n=1 Tax=Donghicola mangrovi TaxID=2729614 RepID=A0A850Q3A6_9RHOB|nr:YjbF family lipoprotein [Donghicola mangrovi]NVO22482.1 YjbF family lipoprotein [Donghicola mangrovi]